MNGEFRNRAGAGPESEVTTLDELVVHLREAGVKRVYLSKPEAFSSGAIPVIATYEYRADSTDDPAGENVREMLVNVFEAIGERIWFEAQTWALDWEVDVAFTDPPTDLIAVYDRGVERRQRDGFNLRSVHFVYEQYREMERSEPEQGR